MPRVDAIRPLSATLAVRAPRTAVLVPTVADLSWQQTMSAALAHRAATWGGLGDLVLPLDGDLKDNELFWRISDAYDADAFVVDNLTGADLVDVAPTLRATRLSQLTQTCGPDMDEEIIAESIDREPLADALIPPDLFELLVQRLAPMHWDSADHPPPEGAWETGHVPSMSVADLGGLPRDVRNPSTSLGTVADLLLTAELGRLNPVASSELAANGTEVLPDAVESPAGLAAKLYTDSGQEGPRPWTLSGHGLAPYGSPRSMRAAPAVVFGEDVWDFALFYALRKLRLRAWWLPEFVLEDTTLAMQFRMRIEHFARQLALPIEVTSFSTAHDSDRIISWFESGGQGGQVQASHWSDLIPDDPSRFYEFGSEANPQALLLHEGSTTALLTPEPQRVRHRSEWETTWLVETQVDGWTPLRNGALAQTLLSGPNMGDYLQRPSSRGVVYSSQGIMVQGGSPLGSSIVRPSMRPRSLLDQVQTILGRVGWQAVSSDKGAFAQRAADLFGGLLPLRDSLLSPDLEALFTVFLSGKREQAPGRWISAEKRRVLTLADVDAIYGNRDQAEALIEGLRAREAVQIGSVLKCRRCRQESWYDIDAFGRSFVCSRCRLSQPADSASWRAVEPVWSYRLDEALLQFLVHRGDLPVIAAAAIADPNGPPTEATFELEVRSTDSSALDGKPLEIDIVLGQGPHLTIGEASVKEVLRTAKAKECERFQTLAELSNRLAARRFLLANAGTWSRRTRETAERAISGPWLSLRVLEQVPMVRRPDNLLADPE